MFRPLCVLKIVFRDKSALSETIVFVLSAMADQGKRLPH